MTAVMKGKIFGDTDRRTFFARVPGPGTRMADICHETGTQKSFVSEHASPLPIR